MQPVRVKVYGLLSLTRRGYLRLLVVELVLLLGLLVARSVLPLPHPDVEPGRTSPAIVLWLWFLDNFPWLVLAAVVLEAIEALFVFRRFAAEEARQRARASESPSST